MKDVLLGLALWATILGGFILILIVGVRYSTDTTVVMLQPSTPGYILRCGPAGKSVIIVKQISETTIYVEC